MSDKIRELADLLYRERKRISFERILHQELGPLLDAAKEAADCPLAGELDRLAAELEGWKAKP